MSIEENLVKIKSELPSEVKLVAVSKFHPIETVQEAYDCGQRVFGESRPQELAQKAAALPSDIEWHFIGHLQKNKLKMVLPYAAVVESVDSIELLNAIEEWAAAHPGFRKMGFSAASGEAGGAPSKAEDQIKAGGAPLDAADQIMAGGANPGENIPQADKVSILLELHIAGEESKQGFSPEEAAAVLKGPARWPHVRFRGLMGMATFTDDEALIRSDFGKLTSLFASLETLRGTLPNLSPDFREMSFGMSEDYKIALSMGATIVRIGTAIFGARNY